MNELVLQYDVAVAFLPVADEEAVLLGLGHEIRSTELGATIDAEPAIGVLDVMIGRAEASSVSFEIEERNGPCFSGLVMCDDNHESASDGVATL